MAYQTKVNIDGVTIKDDSLGGLDPGNLFEWEYERTTGNEISELTMTTTTNIDSLVTLQVGKSVEIWAGWTTSTDKKIFKGFISDFTSEAGQIKITCKDMMWELIRLNVNNIYKSTGPQGGQISEIAKDLIETYGGLTADVQATGTQTSDIISEFRCDNTDIWERLVALAEAVNYIIWYDPETDKVNFKQGGSNDSGVTLSVGSNITEVPKWTNDTSRLVNDLRVDGAVVNTQIRFPFPSGAGQIGTTTDFNTTGIILTKTPESVELLMDSSNPPTTIKQGGTKDASSDHFYYIDKANKTIKPATGSTFPVGDYAIVNYTWLAPAPIHQTNPSSISTYGTWKKQMTLSDIQSIADAEARTSEILSKFSTPFLLGELSIDNSNNPNIELGDKVLVIDDINIPNINQEFVITKQTLSYPGTTQEIEVGDESIRLADWQLDVETRLKRIEELLTLQNQDLILELIDFTNDITIQNRYSKVLSEQADLDTFIWGHPTLGIWGTQKWSNSISSSGKSLYWVKQFENTYTEEFIDTDFKSDNTTATWTNTNSVTFTSGQVAESSSIDFNNGLITTAKLTSTATGTFTYELTANGIDWETVTSGVPHTFTSTGTDLRWRATESGASTGEITKIVLEDY